MGEILRYMETMDIQLFDLKRAYARYGREIEEAVLKVLRSGIYLNGPENAALERELASYLGVARAIAVASGTEALYLLLQALEFPKGSVVFLPSFTFVATAEVVVRSSLRPFFVDVEEDYPNISLASLEEAYDSSLKLGLKPSCVLAVSLYGYPAKLDELVAFCEERGLILLEDICQAFGAKLGEKRIGSFGLGAGASFYPTKTLSAAGDAGMVFTHDDFVAQRIRALKEHGQVKPYYYAFHGVNGRMDEIQAAILRIKFRYLEEELERRKTLAAYYDQVLSTLSPMVRRFEVPPGAEPAFSLYTVRVGVREDLQAYLREKGVYTNIYYKIPLHQQPIYQDALRVSLPNTERLSQEVLSLPFHPYLTSEEIERVCVAIREFYGRD